MLVEMTKQPTDRGLGALFTGAKQMIQMLGVEDGERPLPNPAEESTLRLKALFTGPKVPLYEGETRSLHPLGISKQIRSLLESGHCQHAPKSQQHQAPSARSKAFEKRLHRTPGQRQPDRGKETQRHPEVAERGSVKQAHGDAQQQHGPGQQQLASAVAFATAPIARREAQEHEEHPMRHESGRK